MKLVIFPFTFVCDVPICIIQSSSSLHFVLIPLSCVPTTFIIIESSKSLSHVVFLITFIPSFWVKFSNILLSLITFLWLIVFTANQITLFFHHIWPISQNFLIALFCLFLIEQLLSMVAFFFIQYLSINFIKNIMMTGLIFKILLWRTKANKVGFGSNFENRFF